jgi:PAS domain S-box-containing protein
VAQTIITPGFDRTEIATYPDIQDAALAILAARAGYELDDVEHTLIDRLGGPRRYTMRNRLRRWLNNVPIHDPIERRQALLVQVILLGLSGVLLFAALLTLVAFPFTTGAIAAANLRNSVSNFRSVLFVLAPLVLLRRGYFRIAVVILMVELFLLAFNTFYLMGLEAGWIGALEIALPISLAALALGRRWLLVVYAASIAGVAVTAFARYPLVGLPQNAPSAIIAFALIAGLLALFLDRFGTTFRESLAALRESEEQTRSIVETALDAIITIDAQSLITGWNSQAEMTFGWSHQEVIGQPISTTIIPPRYREAHTRGLKHFLATGEGPVLNKRIELTALRQNGQEFPVELAISPVRFGAMVTFSAFIRDVTERKRAEAALRESEEHYRLLFDSNPLPMWVYDTETLQFLAVNDATIAHYGYRRDEFLSMTIQDIRPPEELPRLVANLATPHQPQERSDSWKHRKNDGTLIDVEIISHTIVFAGRAARMVLANDITERKQAEMQLLATTKRLRVLADASRAFAEVGAEYQALLDQVARTTATLLGEGCNIRLLSDDGVWLQLVALYDGDADKLELTRIVLGEAPLRVDEPSLATRSFQSRQPLLIPVVDREQVRAATKPEYRLLVDRLGLRSMIVVPMRGQGRAIGVLILYRRLPEQPPFDEDDLNLAQDLADRAALAIGNARLFQQVQNELAERVKAEEALRLLNTELEQRVAERTAQVARANDELTRANIGLEDEIVERKQLEAQIRQNEARARSLAELSQTLAEAGLESQSLFETIARRITELVGDSCTVGLLSEDGQWLEAVASYHPDPEGLAFIQALMASTRSPVGQDLVGQVVQTGQPLLLPIVPPETVRARMKPEFWPYLERFGMASVLIVPLRARGHIRGVVRVARDQPGRPYTADDQLFLQDLADRAGLAIENTRLYREARQAREAADRANLAKSEFLSRMSHELRTPLNAILGFAQLLDMERLGGRQADNVQQILRAGKHLLQLINEVLDITRIETGNLPLSPEPVLVSEVVGETLDLVESLAARWAVQILTAALPHQYVQADRQRLKQVLLNLLTNAIKYNNAGGQVTVDCAAAPAQRLRIRVRDTGPGIPAEKLARLFTPFDRLGAEQSEVEGTGLGLALSRRLAEAMGGGLGVESTLGEGSVFWVELPLVESPVERMNRSGPLTLAPDAASGTPRTVLYVEDNLSNLQLIEQVLSYRPAIRLLTAMQGGISLDLAREHHPDVILLDLNLPDIPGIDVLRTLQADPQTRDIRVVVVSADATPGQIERLLAAGARAYLTKPLDVPQFLKVVDELLTDAMP